MKLRKTVTVLIDKLSFSFLLLSLAYEFNSKMSTIGDNKGNAHLKVCFYHLNMRYLKLSHLLSYYHQPPNDVLEADLMNRK